MENLLADNHSNVIITTDNEKNAYSTETGLCVMNLLTEGVGVHHVNKVMTHVANLCGKTLSKLLSVSTINKIGDQRVSVAKMHMAEEQIEKEDITVG